MYIVYSGWFVAVHGTAIARHAIVPTLRTTDHQPSCVVKAGAKIPPGRDAPTLELNRNLLLRWTPRMKNVCSLRNAQRLLPQESLLKKSGCVRIPGNFRHMDVDGSLPGLCVSTGPPGPAKLLQSDVLR